MQEIPIEAIFINAFLMGGIMLFFGIIIKCFNSGDIINFFNEKKHDKEKVSKIVGGDMIISGGLIIASAFISIFINKKYYDSIIYIQGAILFIGVIVVYYHLNKRCRIDKK